VRIEWLPVAARNREQQLAYIEERNPGAAVRMGDLIEAALVDLADHPKIDGPAGSTERANWW
jgi:plasmid stabilization system protein ParE